MPGRIWSEIANATGIIGIFLTLFATAVASQLSSLGPATANLSISVVASAMLLISGVVLIIVGIAGIVGIVRNPPARPQMILGIIVAIISILIGLVSLALVGVGNAREAECFKYFENLSTEQRANNPKCTDDATVASLTIAVSGLTITALILWGIGEILDSVKTSLVIKEKAPLLGNEDKRDVVLFKTDRLLAIAKIIGIVILIAGAGTSFAFNDTGASIATSVLNTIGFLVAIIGILARVGVGFLKNRLQNAAPASLWQ